MPPVDFPVSPNRDCSRAGKQGVAERVLITGGAGFIGSHLAGSHLLSAHEVHILLRPGRAAPPLAAHVHHVDLEDRTALDNCLRSIDPTIIYHLATRTGRASSASAAPDAHELTSDPACLINLMAAAGQVRPRVMIRAGTIAEYGSRNRPSTEEDREQPLTPYGAAMVAATHYCSVLASALRFPVHTARLSLTYGPGQSPNYLVPTVLRGLLRREEVQLRNPFDRRDLAHVDDIVAGLRALSAADIDRSMIINITAGCGPSVRELARLACELLQADETLLAFGEASPAQATTLFSSPRRARNLLGWQAKIPLRDGILSTASAMREEIYA